MSAKESRRKLVLEGLLEMRPDKATILTKDKMDGVHAPRWPEDYTPLFQAVVDRFFDGRPSDSVRMGNVRITIEALSEKPAHKTPYREVYEHLAKKLCEESGDALFEDWNISFSLKIRAQEVKPEKGDQ